MAERDDAPDLTTKDPHEKHDRQRHSIGPAP
jgi:hypothetical protein